MKYIIFEDFSGKPTPIIFPEKINYLELREQIPYSKVLSAGKILFKEGKFVCFDKAKELGVAAQAEDAQLIASLFSEES
ncbi:MAG: hypothetical protein PWR24_1497 [Desulfonauticus sp.]|jgi:hypothetical protein|nr:MAG: Uncharacterized protein XD41_0867 [Desulfonauticus sp. 38_4375]MDK2921940.1 hypothetical protein [Desulfonauticus sp.]